MYGELNSSICNSAKIIQFDVSVLCTTSGLKESSRCLWSTGSVLYHSILDRHPMQLKCTQRDFVQVSSLGPLRLLSPGKGKDSSSMSVFSQFIRTAIFSFPHFIHRSSLQFPSLQVLLLTPPFLSVCHLPSVTSVGFSFLPSGTFPLLNHHSPLEGAHGNNSFQEFP